MRGFSLPARLFLVYGLLLAAVSAAFVPGLRRATAAVRAEYNAGRTDAEMDESNASAFAQILGEFRATMADMLFVKTSRYLHGGVAYAPRLKLDAADESQAYAECKSDTPTLVRQKKEDFRGFFGDLEREVKPFHEGGEAHLHLKADEMVPWFRMMTLVNPNYIRGYRVGAKTLADEKKWREALEFLNEGIANNGETPELFLLYQSLAAFHMRGRYQRGYPWGKEWLPNALGASERCYALGLARRPPLGAVGAKGKGLLWTLDIEEDFRYAAHMVVLLLREEGRAGEALARAREMRGQIQNWRPLEETIQELEAKGGRLAPRGGGGI